MGVPSRKMAYSQGFGKREMIFGKGFIVNLSQEMLWFYCKSFFAFILVFRALRRDHDKRIKRFLSHPLSCFGI